MQCQKEGDRTSDRWLATDDITDVTDDLTVGGRVERICTRLRSMIAGSVGLTS